jgi:type IV pilus assembly protein PilB
MVELDSTDLHITFGSTPVYRVSGDLVRLEGDRLTPDDTKKLCYSVLTDFQKKKLEENWELDASFGIEGLSRFRTNIFFQRGSVAGAFRRIPFDILKFNELGLPPVVETFCRKPRGLILVTGPTGSGKSTTLYAALSRLNTPEVNIMTAEDPVEYNISGINQVHMREDIGLNFATALRSFLRQDPDIIMVGEIRDFETAEVAIRAALTGHLVFSTLHTNDAPSSAIRLINMGIEPFLVASSVNLIAAQRLVRKVCKGCSDLDNTVSKEFLISMVFSSDEVDAFIPVKGKGCDLCDGTGYKGRIALFEVLEITENITNLILRGASTYELKDAAVKEGMLTLRRAGLDKIKAGITTVEEVVRITVND